MRPFWPPWLKPGGADHIPGRITNHLGGSFACYAGIRCRGGHGASDRVRLGGIAPAGRDAPAIIDRGSVSEPVSRRPSPQLPVARHMGGPGRLQGRISVVSRSCSDCRSKRLLFLRPGLRKVAPTARTQVSPDGRRYAYAGEKPNSYAGGKLHVVDVSTGVDTIVYSGGTAYSVVDFAAAGIYVTSAPAPDGATHGLWLQDPSGGQPKLISSEILDPAVGGAAAWGLHLNAADPSPGRGGVEGPLNEILRFDLGTGVSTPWFYRPGTRVGILGFDAAGHPFVRVYTEANLTEPVELWLVQSQSQAIRLFAGGGPTPTQLGAVDSHGVWFDSFRISPNTVWLYAGGSLQKVATIDMVGVIDVFVAGGCVP